MSKHKYSLPALHADGEHSGSEATRLHGRWLALARTTWVAFVLLSLMIYFASLPVYGAQLQAICVSHTCVPGQLTPERAQFLHSIGLSTIFYATFVVVLNIVTAMVWFAVGIVIFWRKHDDWMALLVALALVLVGTTVPPSQSAPVWQWPIQFVDFLAVSTLYLIFCLFPSGRFVPGWLRWLALLYGALNVLDLFPNVFFHLPEGLVLLYFMLLFGCIGVLGVAQIYRYRRVSTPVERQQIKWVVYSCATTIAGEFVLWLLTLIFPSLGQINSLYDLYFNPISIVLILLIPLSVGMAILRSRLWDIDLIIHRTLVYSTLTTILALVYSGCVVLFQWLFRIFTGQDSLLAIILSTLIIGLLFQPLRHHIQEVIDLRFYRRKYNAAQALSAFSEQMRRCQEVDLTALVDDVAAIVEETIQPKHVSIWLCEPEPARANQSQLVYGSLTSGYLQGDQVTESRTASGTLLTIGTRPLTGEQENAGQQMEKPERGRALFFRFAREIEGLVNRTMIYGLVFGVLGLIFAFSLIADQRLLQTQLRPFSEVLIIASTLALVMLFQPLRRRVQPFITRIFYRRRYLVERKLDDFNSSLREEVQLNQLSDHLLSVVNETMQPTYASLWLKDQHQPEPRDDSRRYTRILRM